MAFGDTAYGPFAAAQEAGRRASACSRQRMRAFFDIDTQIDFVYPAGALYGKGAEHVLPAVAQLNRYAALQGIRLFSTTCAHPENAAEFRTWPPHCVVG